MNPFHPFVLPPGAIVKMQSIVLVNEVLDAAVATTSLVDFLFISILRIDAVSHFVDLLGGCVEAEKL